MLKFYHFSQLFKRFKVFIYSLSKNIKNVYSLSKSKLFYKNIIKYQQRIS